MKIFRGPLVNELKNNSWSLWMPTSDIKFWVKAQANSWQTADIILMFVFSRVKNANGITH